MFGRRTLLVHLAMLLAAVACADTERHESIVGSWIIDEEAQREEVRRVSPSELEDFDEYSRKTLRPLRETFHEDGRHEIFNELGGPFEERWKLVSRQGDAVTVRSSDQSWVSRQLKMGAWKPERSPSVVTYTFSDDDHMHATITKRIFGEDRQVSFFFVRDE
jgi:hypothetical protein